MGTFSTNVIFGKMLRRRFFYNIIDPNTCTGVLKSELSYDQILRFSDIFLESEELIICIFRSDSISITVKSILKSLTSKYFLQLC